MTRSINVSVLAVASFLHTNCSQTLSEVLGKKESRHDDNFAGLVDKSKLAILRKARFASSDGSCRRTRLADGILDRLVHNTHRIEMRGESMRKNRGKPNT
jgi:hypothetical protein